MKLYRIDIPVYATAYVLADSPEHARLKVQDIVGEDVAPYVDDSYPVEDDEIHVSTAMTIQKLADDDLADEEEEI